MPPHQLPVFEVLLKKRGRGWSWSVCTAEGQVVMQGAESRRTFARYKANRALFQMLLCAPYSYIPHDNGVRSAGRSRSSI
jgi:hypothetical protein